MKKKIFIVLLISVLIIAGFSAVSLASENNGIITTTYEGSEVLIDTNNSCVIISDYSNPDNAKEKLLWEQQSIPVENINKLTCGEVIIPTLEEDKEVQLLIDQIIWYENQLSNKALSEKDKYDIEKHLIELKNKVKSKGVHILTDEDLALLFGNNSKATTPTTPPTTANNYWYSYGPYSYTKSGTTYNIFIMRVVPRGPGSTLQDYFGFFSLQESNGFWLEDIATCYLQKVIGAFPVIEWLPYELLWNRDPNNVLPSDEGDYYRMSCDIKTSMTFYWVNAYSNYYYDLSLCSTRTSVTDAHHINWYHNNNLKTDSWTDPATTKTAPYYYFGSSSYNAATQYYDSSYYGHDIILTKVKYGFDGSNKKTCNVPYEVYISFIN